MHTPMIIGHRGAPGYRPEHSASGYLLACAAGVDAVEPDVVSTSDGVLVVRHENEIGSTTNVAEHPEFADRYTTKIIDGADVSGWFTEDFTWNELARLRARERLPHLRRGSARHNDADGLLRLSDLFRILEDEARVRQRSIDVVVEVKHPTYFRRLGIELDVMLAELLRTRPYRGGNVIVECFELTLLQNLAGSDLDVRCVLLCDLTGSPADLVDRDGTGATTYREWVTSEGLRSLSAHLDGISVHSSLLLGETADSTLVRRAHAHGLSVYAWTLRPENAFLGPRFRGNEGEEAFGDWRGLGMALLRTGVDGLFVDHPDLGVALREDFVSIHSGAL